MQARTEKAAPKAQRSAQKSDMKARTAAQTNTRERSTTGQASRETNMQTRAQARPNITAEQRTRLRTAMNARNVPHIRRVNFALRRGILVPRSVHFVRVAAFPVLIDLYPAYRPYSFFVTGDQVVFLDSGRRIVAVEPFEGGAVASSGGGGAMAMDVDLSPEEIRSVQTVLVDEGFPLEVTGVWDVRTRDALISFQRRRGFAATGFIDTRTVAALRLNGKISENHIRGANRATIGRGNARESFGGKTGSKTGMESNKTNMQPRQDRATSGQGGKEPKASMSNEPKAQPKAMNEPKAGMSNEPKAGQGAKPQAEQKPAQRSTTGQGGGQDKMKGSEPKTPTQNKY
jgi:peptidoglycan hydrolase-like protein with peptidoglycan-binding domain